MVCPTIPEGPPAASPRRAGQVAASTRALTAVAKAALAAADAGDARLGQVAAHIRASASLPAEGGGCRTPEVVMAARNVL